MATINVLETEITNQDYINFLKVGLALVQLQKGLSPFITRKLQTIHDTIINNIRGAYCGSCTTGNILIHPRKNCKGSGCVCWCDPFLKRRPCKGHCKRFYDELVKLHRYDSPQMKYVSIPDMFNDPWQVAKCFLPPSGYTTIASANDCDATGLCSIIINCTEFGTILGITVNKLGTRCFHSGNMSSAL